MIHHQGGEYYHRPLEDPSSGENNKDDSDDKKVVDIDEVLCVPELEGQARNVDDAVNQGLSGE